MPSGESISFVINYGVLVSKLILGFFLLCWAPFINAAQWITLTSSDIQNIQIVQANNSHGSPEGLYVGLKSPIIGGAANYCTRKDFVVITDQKLIERAYSGILFAMSMNKSFKFYIDKSGNCVQSGPVVTMFMLYP